MDQLLKKLHTQFKLLEDLTDLTPEEEKEFKERMAAERNRESRYQEYKRSKQGDDSEDNSGDTGEISTYTIMKELHTALEAAGIDIPDTGNSGQDMIVAIQSYKKAMELPTDADALVKLLKLAPSTTEIEKQQAADKQAVTAAATNSSTPKADATSPATPNPADTGGASEFGGAPAKPEEEEPTASKIGSYAGNALGATIKQHYNMAKQAGQYGLDALSGLAKGAVKGWDSVKEDHNTSRSLSESDEMSLLISKLKRLDETTQLNEVRLPPAVEKLADDFGWLFKRSTQAEVADALGRTPKLTLSDKSEIATGWTRLSNSNMFSGPNGRTLDAKALAKELKLEGEHLEKTFGVTKGTQFTSELGQTFTKQADGSWLSQDGATLIKKTDPLWAKAENSAAKSTVVPGANPSTTNPTSSIVSPQRAKELAAETNFLKTNSLPANLSWLAKSKKFLKYTAALAALGLVFDNGDIIMKGVKKVLGLGDADPAGAGGAAGDTAAADAKNSEEIKKLVKQIQDLENDHGKDSDPAWSKAVEHANAVFKRLGIAPFDNSIPKPKPVAPAPRPVAPPAPVAAASAVPPESVVPQDMVQPVDLQQNYQQQPVNQRNSNTFIPIPIPLGGFGGGRGNGGGRGPQNGRGYPGAGGQLRGGGGNRGGR